MSDTWPQQIEAFLTSDREIHRSRTAAEGHQQRIDGARLATEMLESGIGLGRCLRESGLVTGDHYHELDDVTKDTKLVISHWQCSDRPGYSPVRIDCQGRVFVFGDAGSWSGPYGSWCTPTEIISYLTRMKEWAEVLAKHERRRAGLVTP